MEKKIAYIGIDYQVETVSAAVIIEDKMESAPTVIPMYAIFILST